MFNLCDIHFHTKFSFDAYENVGATPFDVDNICNNYMSGDNEDDNVKLVVCTDHNYFNYNNYIDMRKEFAKHNIVLLPGIEVNGDNKVHWIFIFNDNTLSENNKGEELTQKIISIYKYDEDKQIVPEQSCVAQSNPIIISEFVSSLIDLKIDFLAIPHLDKASGWYNILKKHPEQLKLINYLLCDGIINGFESKKMENAIKEKISMTEKFITLHSDEIEELNKKMEEEVDINKKKIINEEIENLFNKVTQEINFLKIPNDLQTIIDNNDVANIYGSDFHGKKNSVYNKDNLFYMKSDLTFNGLKFALLDWNSRIFSKKRMKKYLKNSNYVITSVDMKINGHKKNIVLDDSLNSIIGSRGSGKSFLLSLLINKSDIYKSSKINEQIQIEKIHFLNDNDSKFLNTNQYDYISQKNYKNGNDKNIYDLLAKAPYSIDEFKKGLKSFYQIETKDNNGINDFIDQLNCLRDLFLEAQKIRNQELDLSYINDYNEYFSSLDDSNKVNQLINSLYEYLKYLKLKQKNDLLELQKFKASLKNLLDQYEKVKDIEVFKLVAVKVNEINNSISNVKILYQNIDFIINEQKNKIKRRENIENIMNNIYSDIVSTSDNMVNILNKNIAQLKEKINSYCKIILNIKNIRENIDVNKEYVNESEYNLIDDTKIKNIQIISHFQIDDLSKNNIDEIFYCYNYNNFKKDDIKNMIKDYGYYYLNNIYKFRDNRRNSHYFKKPNLSEYVYILKDNETIEWDKQSPGQRANLLLDCILTGVSNKILIIDQPEDDLDNETIYNKIVRMLRDVKLNRQVIIVTHNANLAITADSNILIICENNNENFNVISGTMESTNKYEYHSLNDDRKKGTILDLACDILEGGKDALKKRVNKIGIRELFYKL